MAAIGLFSTASNEHCFARDVACNVIFSHSHCVDATKNKETLFDNTVLQKIIDIIGGCDAFCSLPKLVWNESFFDGIGSISRIFPDDLTGPVMVGVDSKRRPFITFKTTQSDQARRQNAKPVVTTLFQESAQEANSIWLKGGGVFGPMNLIRECGGDVTLEDTCLGIFSALYRTGDVKAPFQVGLDPKTNEFTTTMRSHMLVETKSHNEF